MAASGHNPPSRFSHAATEADSIITDDLQFEPPKGTSALPPNRDISVITFGHAIEIGISGLIGPTGSHQAVPRHLEIAYVGSKVVHCVAADDPRAFASARSTRPAQAGLRHRSGQHAVPRQTHA
jgi:hypothetical protein